MQEIDEPEFVVKATAPEAIEPERRERGPTQSTLFMPIEIPVSELSHLVNKVVPHENLMETAEHYATMIIENSQQAIRSAKETILDVVGRTLGDALCLETINAYSSLGDFSEARERLAQFYAKRKNTE